MKAKQEFTVYLKGGVRVPYYSGDTLDGITVVTVNVGAEIPPEIGSDILSNLQNYVNLETVTEEEKKGRKQPTAFLPPRKYSMDSLTKLINEKGRKSAKEAMIKILDEEFKCKSKSEDVGYLRNKILELQEHNRGK